MYNESRKGDFAMTEKTDRELLELILKNQERLEQKQDALAQKQDVLAQKQDKLESNQDSMFQDIRVIKLTLENDIRRSINLLLELQLSNSERFQNIEKSIQTLEDNYVIDDVIREINQL